MAEGAAFIPFRSIGIVAGPVKASVTGDAQTPTVTTTTGRGWIAWRAHSLVPAIYGNPLGKSIRCLAAWSNITAAACKDGICLYRRAHIIGELEGLPAEPEAVREMVFMGNVLVAYFSDPPSLAVWELQKDEMEGERRGERVSVGAVRSFSLGVSKARGTFLIHPATYLNKVLVGLDDGRAQLWNINSCKLIYEFSFHSPPLAASPSPALDVVAIGLSDGTIAVHNLRYDERIASFRHSPLQNPSPVTCLSFRSGPGQPLLAAGGEDGAISVYDLEASQLHCNLSPAHTGRVVTAEFLPSQPTLLTTGSDNAIQLYSFDLEGGAPRLLKSREGHSEQVKTVRFYGDGKRLLSGGLDRSLRVQHTTRETHSRELSQGHVRRRARKFQLAERGVKLPPALGIAFSEQRERDWDNVLTCHQNDPVAYSWRLWEYSLGEHDLRGPGQPSPVTSVAVSPCGSFGYVGYETGDVHRFSMQSGIHRGSFCHWPEGNEKRTRGPASKAKGGGVGPRNRESDLWHLAGWDQEDLLGSVPAHEGKVCGLASDNSNRMLVTCGRDGWIRSWQPHSRRLQAEVEVDSPAVHMTFHSPTSLCAVSCDDLVVRMCDCESARRVRTFSGPSDRITDLEVTADGRWLLVSSMDGTLQLFDIPSAQRLQVMHVSKPIISMSASRSMELLATAHSGEAGVVLWGNAVLYGGVAQAQLARHIEASTIPGPGGALREGVASLTLPEEVLDQKEDDDDGDADEKASGDAELQVKGQVAKGAVTMARASRSKWQSLVYLEDIKERNKPEKPEPEPEPAPFVLPSQPSLRSQPVFDVSKKRKASQEVAEESSRPSLAAPDSAKDKAARRDLLSAMAHTAEESSDENIEGTLTRLCEATPADIDAEMRMVGLSAPTSKDLSQEDVHLLAGVLDFLKRATERGTHFEMVQSFLAALLRVHSEAFRALPELASRCSSLLPSVRRQWERLESHLHSSRCVIGFVSGQVGG